jgi:hypothetical protein
MSDADRCPPPCGKLRWTSRKKARAWAKKSHRGDHVQAYRCGDWHLGHMSRAKLRGLL